VMTGFEKPILLFVHSVSNLPSRITL